MLQVRDLWKIVHHDVRLIRMMHYIILMVTFGHIKRTANPDRRYDWTLKHFRIVELLNISLRDALLIFV